MMKTWFFMLLALPLFATANPGKVEFFKGNLSSAKKQAAQEGKLYFAEFTASWCAPCRVLEETTFSDPEVIDYIAKHYIPVKVDIDDFDGIAMKQVYNVQTIPTIIVFNSKGKMLEKYSKGLPSSTMMALLKKHNTPENRIKTGRPVSRANTSITVSSPKPKINRPASTYSAPAHSPMRQQAPVAKPEKKPNTPISYNEPIPSPSRPMPQGNGLYRFKVSHQASSGFSVQIGAYREYGNVLREVARVQDKFDQPVIVHIVRNTDFTVYKILIGEFSNRHQAIQYQSKMNTKGVAGVIKDLSLMK